MRSIICRGADVGGEVGSASWMSADRVDYLWPVLHIGELGKNVGQSGLGVA